MRHGLTAAQAAVCERIDLRPMAADDPALHAHTFEVMQTVERVVYASRVALLADIGWTSEHFERWRDNVTHQVWGDKKQIACEQSMDMRDRLGTVVASALAAQRQSAASMEADAARFCAQLDLEDVPECDNRIHAATLSAAETVLRVLYDGNLEPFLAGIGWIWTQWSTWSREVRKLATLTSEGSDFDIRAQWILVKNRRNVTQDLRNRLRALVARVQASRLGFWGPGPAAGSTAVAALMREVDELRRDADARKEIIDTMQFEAQTRHSVEEDLTRAVNVMEDRLDAALTR